MHLGLAPRSAPGGLHGGQLQTVASRKLSTGARCRRPYRPDVTTASAAKYTGASGQTNKLLTLASAAAIEFMITGGCMPAWLCPMHRPKIPAAGIGVT